MTEAELAAMLAHDEAHWWYRGRRRTLAAGLDGRALRSGERRVGKERIYQCDWSSDVSSSDLHDRSRAGGDARPRRGPLVVPRPAPDPRGGPGRPRAQIGRAACRERAYISV